MMRSGHSTGADTPSDIAALAAENQELRLRLRELEDTLGAIHAGEVDALVVNDDIYILESANATDNRLRQGVLLQMKDAVFAFDRDDKLIFLNQSAEQRYGIQGDAALGRDKASLFTEIQDEHLSVRPEPLNSGSPLPSDPPRADIPAIHRLHDGSSIYVEQSLSTLLDPSGQSFGSLLVVRDVTESRRTSMRRDALARFGESLRELDTPVDVGDKAVQMLGETLEVLRTGFVRFDLPDNNMRVACEWLSPGASTIAHRVRAKDFGDLIRELEHRATVSVSDARIDPRTRHMAALLDSLDIRSLVCVPYLQEGRLYAVLFIHNAQVRHWTNADLSFISEVAERTEAAVDRVNNAAALRQSEARLREVNESLEATVQARTQELIGAQEALRQSQKMEAVGQLTGGIAHDFNNLLAGMSVSLELIRRRLQKAHYNDIDRYLDMGSEGIKRAASLTQRLLAFARRQTLDPRATDINRLVTGMQELIERSIGPNVSLTVVDGEGLWIARIDVPQLENALLNLCINARDAMAPAGGKLIIETSNHLVEGLEAATHELTPGEYVALSVTDTGVGIPRELINRIFDPFFTTKPTGQGTGLGLSMVYGFVRQSGGQVRVHSEPGQGTTMRMYFPRHFSEEDAMESTRNTSAVPNGKGKRIMLIDDEATIRTLIAEELREAGYVVTTAEDGPSALRILEGPIEIDLLITDVGLPGGLNGRQVADAVREKWPALKVLFITGYAEVATVDNGLLAPGMHVLTKPFEIAELADKIKMLSNDERAA
ncbi:ATP-binding protein [Diaphorobacter caeni]|uniref:ATP-binding protein n=1 Tax=Diaphorobacter caeni TaxID=2784387 RepID=UPI00188EDC58|nr:ATP-binding protein [Diaphorobacter caeni]MBF5005867.1 response regulator [Diaphorobacter caeni]